MFPSRLLTLGRLPALLAALLLAGCSGPAPRDYAGTAPEFRLEDYFDGEVRAWGVFRGRDGALRRQFTVDILGRMDGDELVLEEDFRYRDGETERRVWRIRPTGPHSYEGHAGDVVGVARGEAHGSVLRWQYVLALETDSGTWELSFDDWMFLQEDGVLLNQAEVSKFGFTVGEVLIAFQRRN